MPKKVFEIKDFTAGLNAYSDPRDIESNEFAQSWNINTSKKGVARNGGAAIESIRNLPHTNTNISQGYGLFATGVDYEVSNIFGEFANGFEQGTLQTAYDDEDTTECIRAGDFSSTSHWAESGDFTLANPTTYSHSTGVGSLYQDSGTGSGWAHPPSAAKTHRLTFTIASVSGPGNVTSVTLKGGDGYLAQEDVVLFATATNSIANGTYDVLFLSYSDFIAADNFQIDVVSSDSCSFSIDDISITQVNAVHLAAYSTHIDYTSHQTDDYYNNYMITIDTGTGLGQTRRIVDYTGATRVALLDSTFGTNPNASSTYKIYNWVGDGAHFGSTGRIDYIDSTGSSSFSGDDSDSADFESDVLILRTKASATVDGKSEDLGYITYNPSTSATYESTGIQFDGVASAGSDVSVSVQTLVATEGNVLNRRIYTASGGSSTSPTFIGICTSVTNSTTIVIGTLAIDTTDEYYLYVDAVSREYSTTTGNLKLIAGLKYNLTFWASCLNPYKGYVSNKPYGERPPFIQLYSDSVTDGTNTGLYLFQSDVPTFLAGANSTYGYGDNVTKNYVTNGDFETGSATGGTSSGPTSWTRTGTGFTCEYTSNIPADAYGDNGDSLNMDGTGGFSNGYPSTYIYQDLTLDDNQYYNLSFVHKNPHLDSSIHYAIIDRTSGSDVYLKSWTDVAPTGFEFDGENELTTTENGYKILGQNKYTDFPMPTRFFVPEHGTPGNDRTIRIAFSISDGANHKLDSVIVNKSYPDLFSSINRDAIKKGKMSDWIQYSMSFTVPVDYNNATDWVFRLHGGTWGYQNGASATKDTTTIYFNEIRLESEKHDNLLFLNDNTASKSDVYIYSYNSLNWFQKIIRFSKSGLKPVYTYVNGMLKISDANFNSGNVSKLFYRKVNNSLNIIRKSELETWNTRDNAIISSPSFTVSSSILEEGVEGEIQEQIIDNTFDVIEYSDNVTYKDALQWIVNSDPANGEMETQGWNLDNLSGVIENPSILSPHFPGRVIYNSQSATNNAVEADMIIDQDAIYPSEAPQRSQQITGYGFYNDSLYQGGLRHDFHLLDTYSSAEQSILNSYGYYNGESGEWGTETPPEGDANAYDSQHLISNTNPFYIAWGGNELSVAPDGETIFSDMRTFGLNNGASIVAKVSFEFTYHLATVVSALDSDGDNKNFDENPHPRFQVQVGALSTEHNFFTGNNGISLESQKTLSKGNVSFDGTKYKETAIWYKDEELFDFESQTMPWNESPLWDSSTFTHIASYGGEERSRWNPGGESFTGEVHFGALSDLSQGGRLRIESNDHMLMRFGIFYPKAHIPRCHTVNWDDTTNAQWDFGRHEYIKFQNINVHFYSNEYVAALQSFDESVQSSSDATNLSFVFSEPSSNENPGVGWEGRTFKIASTSVNMFDEESSLNISNKEIGTVEGGDVVPIGYSPIIMLSIGFEVIRDTYRKKIKFYMKDTESNIWYLQFWIDLDNVTINTTTSNYSYAGVKNDSSKSYLFQIPHTKMTNYNEVDSYESQTLISQDIAEGNSANLTCDYKTAVVANNRLYVGNIKQNGRIYGDRMIKSPIGKYNILPSSNFIDVAINDGDEITALEFYKDKLIQFKKNKVFVINTSGDYEFLEETFNNIGVSLQCEVVKTPYGVAWINAKGCFLYNGEKVENLIENKLTVISDESSIENNYWFLGSRTTTDEFHNIGAIGYNETSKELVVRKFLNDGMATGTFPDGYIYHMPTSSWYFSYKAFQGYFLNTDNGDSSNFVNDKDGNLIYYLKNAISGSNDINDIFKWDSSIGNDEELVNQKGISSSSANARSFYFTTADITFGDVTARKKVYKVYVTFKSVNSSDEAAHSKVFVKHSINGAASYTEFDDNSTNYSTTNGLTDGASSTGWITAILKPSSSINNIYTFQLQFFGDVLYAVGFEINDISIVYREKRVK